MELNGLAGRRDDNGTSTFTPLSLSESFPIDQQPASSTDSVSFSCHNVLQVCTRWIVYLYLSTSLSSPAAEIVPRQHSLCHFSERDSLEFVVGAKWSGALVPEVRYPAESRLCVMTTSSVIVYRVTRHGDTRIEVSHGVGIGTPRMLAIVERKQADPSASASTKAADTSPSASRQRTSPAKAKTTKSTTPQSGRKRGRPSANKSVTPAEPVTSSPSSSANSDADEAVSSSPAVATVAEPDPIVLDAVWLPGDALVILTSIGIHVIPFEDDSTDDAAAVTRCLNTPAHTFAEDIIGSELAPPSCLSIVHTSPMWSRHAECTVASHLVVVASAFVSRVFLVGKNNNHVTFLHYVETPLIASVPSCVCALQETVGHPSVDPSTHPARTSVEVTLLLSCPTNTICGTFTVSSPPPLCAEESAAQVPTPALFTLRHVYHSVSGALPVTYVRGFCVTPVTSVPATAQLTTAPFLVLGVAQRAYYGLLLTNPTVTTLFRCVSLVTTDTVPANSTVAVCGVAVHASTSLAVSLHHTGYKDYPALHLLPLSAGDPQSPLHRQLSLTGTFNGILERYTDMEARSAASCSNVYLHWLWEHQRDASFFTWEPLFALSTTCIALHSYADGRRYLTNKKTFLRELSAERQRGAELPTCVLRSEYLRLRQRWGVELFLRWPAPLELAVTAHVPGSSVAGDAAASQCGSNWWHVLLQLWRQHPWDPTMIAELTLAKAIHVLAVGTHYAQLALDADETLRRLEDRCAPSATTLSVESALGFVQLYLRQLAHCRTAITHKQVDTDDALLTHTSAYSTTSASDAADGAETGTAPLFLLPWAASASWDEALRAFLAKLDGSDLDGRGGKIHTSGDMTTVRFPCSVCDAPGAATFNLSFRCLSVHLPYNGGQNGQAAPSPQPLQTPESHVTVFSGSTFSPLSLFCENCVLTRCLGCGFADYATGPLCRLCGGLLV